MPTLMSCAFVCNYYLHTWIIGAAASLIGVVLSSVFMLANNFEICKIRTVLV